MPDFIGLEDELNTKGTKVVYDVKHNEKTLSFYYQDVQEEKDIMDAIVQSYLTNYHITSTLSDTNYKGDAIIN